jgi:iron complex transport system substrate-binding protein
MIRVWKEYFMKKLCVICLVFVMSFLTACTQEAKLPDEKASEAVTFTDDLGREVTVEDPQRVAALLGSFADMWMLAGGTVCAAPDDAWDDFQLELSEDAVNLGQNNELSLEKLFASEPDLILASANKRIDMEWTDTLEKSGIPTAYFDVADFEDYLRVLKICTDITGREDLYEAYGLSVQEEIQAVLEASAKRVSESGAPKVLFLRASASYIRVKNSEGSVLGEMLKSLGCINIADSNDSLLENISMEHILQEDPQFIFFVQSGDDKEGMEAHVQQFIQEHPAWQELTAVKEGRVFYMDKNLYNLKPNDRWGEAYEELEAILAEGQK